MPRAVLVDEFGSVDVLQLREVPEPTAGPGEVVVQVVAASANPADTPFVPGR